MQRTKCSYGKNVKSLTNRGILGETKSPFVCHIIPFVRSITPRITPFIRHNNPFIRIGANFRLQFGVTLIELMITLTIFAIMGAFALPNFRQTLLNHATTARANEFLADLKFARSEAMKRGMRVEVCIPDAAQTGCDYGASWSGPAGRVVGVRDPALAVLDVIRVREPLSAIRSLGVPIGMGYTSVSFFNSGLVQFRSAGNIIAPAGVTAVFGLCHDKYNDGLMGPEDLAAGKNIRISPTGGVKVSSPATACI